MAICPPDTAILIVEDEWLIAETVECTLQDAGYRTVGPAASVVEATELLKSNPIDLAVLDVNLGAEQSLPIADWLGEHGVPYFFVTGYGAADLPLRFRSAVILGKPMTSGKLIDTVSAVLRQSRAAREAQQAWQR